jgi:hypothetical protein
MTDKDNQIADIILVLCHSFFHDAFRLQMPVNAAKFATWRSSHFVANLIIEKQAEIPEGTYFTITSKQVFDDFASKFEGEKPSPRQKETVEILRNSIAIIEGASIINLSLDDSVFAICDTLYSRSNYAPLLISDIPKKKEKAEAFYQKKNPKAKIPFPIYTVAETELFLRGRFPDLSASVDERIRNTEQIGE